MFSVYKYFTKIVKKKYSIVILKISSRVTVQHAFFGIIALFQCHFAMNHLKTCRSHSLGHTKRGNLIGDKLLLIISNTSIEKILLLAHDNIFDPFSPGFHENGLEFTHQDSAARCTFSLPRPSPHKVVPSPPHPGRSSFSAPSRHHRTWNIHSSDPTDSIGHWLKDIRHGQWQQSTAHSFRAASTI